MPPRNSTSCAPNSRSGGEHSGPAGCRRPMEGRTKTVAVVGDSAGIGAALRRNLLAAGHRPSPRGAQGGVVDDGGLPGLQQSQRTCSVHLRVGRWLHRRRLPARRTRTGLVQALAGRVVPHLAGATPGFLQTFHAAVQRLGKVDAVGAAGGCRSGRRCRRCRRDTRYRGCLGDRRGAHPHPQGRGHGNGQHRQGPKAGAVGQGPYRLGPALPQVAVVPSASHLIAPSSMKPRDASAGAAGRSAPCARPCG